MHNYYTHTLLHMTYVALLDLHMVMTTSGQIVAMTSTYVGFASVTFDNVFIKKPCGTKNHR